MNFRALSLGPWHCLLVFHPFVHQVRDLLEASSEAHAEVSRAREDELIPLDSDDKRVLWGPLPSASEPQSQEGKRESRPPVIVVQTAPAVRVTISEAFGMAPGAISTGQLVSHAVPPSCSSISVSL